MLSKKNLYIFYKIHYYFLFCTLNRIIFILNAPTRTLILNIVLFNFLYWQYPFQLKLSCFIINYLKFLLINFVLDFTISDIDRTNVATYDKSFYVPECVVTWSQRPWSAVFGPLQVSSTIQFSARHHVRKSVYTCQITTAFWARDSFINDFTEAISVDIGLEIALFRCKVSARQNRRVIKRASALS